MIKEILTTSSPPLLTLTLNRPKALNALNLNMISLLTQSLLSAPPAATHVLLNSASQKAFCAGGDVKQVISDAFAKSSAAHNFFFKEYALNHLIATYRLPIVAVLDGITMGGGVGISVHAPFRIVTENTVFAMPEVAIGLYPDVGGSFFMSRMDGELGTFLALTGQRLKGNDVYFAGIGTHYVPSDRIKALSDKLASLSLSGTKGWAAVNEVLEEHTVDANMSGYLFSAQKRRIIDECFIYDTVEEILSALKKEGSEFANKTRETMLKMSPTSLKLTLRQLRLGGKSDLAECFQIENRMSKHVLDAFHLEGKSKDFGEGVRAVLVERTGSPQWKPSDLTEVTDEDIEWYFKPVEKELELLNEVTYQEYPYNFGLPKESEIKKVSTGDVEETLRRVKHNAAYHAKKGLEQKVEYYFELNKVKSSV